jgi:hypothetical protein
MNLVTCLGLNPSASAKTLKDHPKHVLYHAATRKHTFKGVISTLEPKNNDDLYVDFIAI